MDATKNFAKAQLAAGYDSSATSITLLSGQAARLPAPPFNATWWNVTEYADPSDDPDVEIVRITGVAGDVLTVTRAQEGTSAVAHNASGKVYLLLAGVTSRTISSEIAPVLPSSGEKAALAGTSGTPGAGNRYVTDSDSRLTGGAHTHDASAVVSGTLSTDRFSAYNDLVAESKIGTGASQVAAGDHGHTGYQAADPDLAALAALSGTGFARRTAADSWSVAPIGAADLPALATYGDETTHAGALTAGNWYRIAKSGTYAQGSGIVRVRLSAESVIDIRLDWYQGLPTIHVIQARGFNYSVNSLVELRCTHDQNGAGAWDHVDNLAWLEVKINPLSTSFPASRSKHRIFPLYGWKDLVAVAYEAGVEPNGTTILERGGVVLTFDNAGYANDFPVLAVFTRWGAARYYLCASGNLRIDGVSSPKLILGSDVNLYRSAADVLKTDDHFAAGGLTVGALAGVLKAASGVISASAVVNADVSESAAIAESKLALNHATHSNGNDPSAGEKAALAGTSGSPGDGNRFVTSTDPRLVDARSPSAHSHGVGEIVLTATDRIVGRTASGGGAAAEIPCTSAARSFLAAVDAAAQRAILGLGVLALRNLVVNADVSASAAIAESKLALNHATHSNANDPTPSQKGALSGSHGAPSSINRFVTETDPRLEPSGHTHDAAAIVSGIISNDRFSAYGDLTSESRIGSESWQLARGDHSHGNLVPALRQVVGLHSISGGGDLTVDRAVSLVGDAASPGPNRFYGTNSQGVRGWQPGPSGAGVPTVFSHVLSVDTPIPSANSWVDGPKLLLEAGIYIVHGGVVVRTPGTYQFIAIRGRLLQASAVKATTLGIAGLADLSQIEYALAAVNLSAHLVLTGTSEVKIQVLLRDDAPGWILAALDSQPAASALYATRF